MIGPDELVTDDPQVFAGIPVGIQIACPRWQEQKLFSIAMIVQNVIGYLLTDRTAI